MNENKIKNSSAIVRILSFFLLCLITFQVMPGTVFADNSTGSGVGASNAVQTKTITGVVCHDYPNNVFPSGYWGYVNNLDVYLVDMALYTGNPYDIPMLSSQQTQTNFYGRYTFSVPDDGTTWLVAMDEPHSWLYPLEFQSPSYLSSSCFAGEIVTSYSSEGIATVNAYLVSGPGANPPAPSITVSFRDDSIGFLENITVNSGGVLSETQVPVLSKEGYEFLGWSSVSNSPYPDFNIFTVYQSDKTYYPVWKKTTHQVQVEYYYIDVEGNDILLDSYITLVPDQQKFKAEQKHFAGYTLNSLISDLEVTSISTDTTLKIYYTLNSFSIQARTDVVVPVTNRQDSSKQLVDWETFLKYIDFQLLDTQTQMPMDSSDILTISSPDFNLLDRSHITLGYSTQVTVEVETKNGQKDSVVVNVKVSDITAPEIIFSTSRQILYHAGGQHPVTEQQLLADFISTASIMDNYDSDSQVNVSIEYPLGESFDNIRWNQKGTYAIYLVAEDSSGNCSQKVGVIVLQ